MARTKKKAGQPKTPRGQANKHSVSFFEKLDKETGRGARQDSLPGVEVEHITPEGALEFRVTAVPGKARDGVTTWEIRAKLDGRFVDRFLDAAKLLGESVRLTGVGAELEHMGKVLAVRCRAGSGSKPHAIEVLVSGSTESHKLLGRMVAVQRMQLDLPLGSEVGQLDPTQRSFKKKSGTCSVCGCTALKSCAAGCSWANSERTLCTLCVPLQEVE